MGSGDVCTTRLVALPGQSPGCRSPHGRGPTGRPGQAGLDHLLDEAFDPDGPLAETYAVVVVHRGRLVAERYGGADPPAGPDRSVRHDAAVVVDGQVDAPRRGGVLVGDGRLDLGARPRCPPGRRRRSPGGHHPRAAAGDPRRARLRRGLRGPGRLRRDGDAVGAGRTTWPATPPTARSAALPGRLFHYSSGTTNIVSGVVARRPRPGRALPGVPGRPPLRAHRRHVGRGRLRRRRDLGGLVDPVRHGPRFRPLRLSTARRDVGGPAPPPAGWVDHGRRPRSVDPETG